jgi:predicted nucleic acid-binding Zn finger protein
MSERCKDHCIRALGLEGYKRYIEDGKFTIEIFHHLLNRFNKSLLFAYRRFGEGRSKLIHIIDPFTNFEGRLYTYLGMHGEYIIIPEVSYCGCMSRFPHALERRRICPHIIGFCLDCLFGEIEEITIDDLPFDDAIKLIYESMFE